VSYFCLGRTWPRQQGWARISLAHKHMAGPKPVWPREEKTNNAGPESAWPSNITSGGELFSPSPPACRTLFVLHAGEKQRNCKQLRGRKVTWRGGDGALLVWLLRWRCCGGGRWRCCGSRAAAPNSNVTASGDGKKGLCSSLLLRSPPLLLLRFLSPFVRI